MNDMNQENWERLKNLLKKKSKILEPLFRKKNTDCYRIYDREQAGIPLTIDKYGEYYYILDYSDSEVESVLLEKGVIDVLNRFLYCAREKIIFKSRLKRQNHEQHEKIDIKESMIQVKENGLIFNINLYDYIDTGLFLDHRVSRERIKEVSQDLNLLNLFCYTGSFSVYAAMGGARSVTSVDLSASYLDWAKKNWTDNLIPEVPRFIQKDVFQFLQETKSKWDLIILDPPTFSNSRKMENTLDIQRDYSLLINSCLEKLNKNGQIFFSTNYKTFRMDKNTIKSRKIEETTQLTVPAEFKNSKPHKSWVIEK